MAEYEPSNFRISTPEYGVDFTRQEVRIPYIEILSLCGRLNLIVYRSSYNSAVISLYQIVFHIYLCSPLSIAIIATISCLGPQKILVRTIPVFGVGCPLEPRETDWRILSYVHEGGAAKG